MRLLTGDRPTGRVHLGHYVGSLKNRVELQDKYETYLLVADLHMLTTKPDKESIANVFENARGMVLDHLACGIDPSKVTFYLHSTVQEVFELNLIFEMLVTVNRLSRLPSLKDMARAAHITEMPFGLLGYPVMQAADILLPKAHVVPVGKDNAAHVEITREIAGRLNRTYGEVSPEPELLLGEVPTLFGTDGKQKMSKSLDNAIFLSDDAQAVEKKVRSMYTDPKRVHAHIPGTVEGNPVFFYHDALNDDKSEVADLKERYEKGAVGDAEVKAKLTGAINRLLAPMRERYARYAEEGLVERVLVERTEKAKGLEFPVVILPGVHQGARTPRKGPSVQHDWSSGCYGVSLGSQRNLGSVLVGNKMAAREEAEQRRLLYVGMTRARDLLVLSGGLVRKPGRDAVLGLLQEAIGSEALEGAGADIEVGAAHMTRTIVPATTMNRRRPRKAVASGAAPSLPTLIERYAIRQMRRTESRTLARQLTPSRMHDDPLVGQAARSREHKTEGYGRFVGICAHALLERWDFSVVTPPTVTELELLCRQIVPPDAGCREAVRDDLASLMSSFLLSECYRRLQGAEILGREIPFIIPWQEGQVMEGVIDLMYRLDGRLWIADYKTDQIAAVEAQARAQQYAQQAEVYRVAAARCLGGEAAAFECVFLRPGVRVEL